MGKVLSRKVSFFIEKLDPDSGEWLACTLPLISVETVMRVKEGLVERSEKNGHADDQYRIVRITTKKEVV